MNTPVNDTAWNRRLRKSTIACAIGAIALLVIAGPGHRFGFFAAGPAVLLSLGAGLIAIIGAVLGAITVFRGLSGGLRNQFAALVVATVACVAVAAQLFGTYRQAKSVPAIHDISTDVVDPPQFDAIRALRAGAPNPADYSGEETAKLQRAAYPDIDTVTLDQGVSDAVRMVTNAAEKLGWDIVRSDPVAGIVEATDTTFWYGYKDDVVIRVRVNNGATLLDVRSKSREGRSDLGTNAKRIRSFLAKIDNAE